MAPGSLALGAALTALGVPAAWILAAIIVSAAMALTTGEELPVGRRFYSLARGFIGMLAGLPLTAVPAATLAGFLPAALAVSFVTVGIGMIGGMLLHRTQPKSISWETGIMSMLPGGASLMPALASQLGADYRYVALTQYLRLLAVSMSLPMVVALLNAPGGGTRGTVGAEAAESGLPDWLAAFGNTDTTWWLVLLTVAIALVGERIGRLLRLPAAAVLGPLVLTVAVSAVLPAGYSLEPHYAFQVLAFMSIGWVCGGGLSVPALRAFARQLLATIAFILAVIGTGALTAWPLTWWLNITYFEAYLATSPGALETVLALSAEGGAGPAVVAVQVVRLIVVLVVAGYLPQILDLLRRLRRRGA